jgi:hypothetical protein
MEDKEDFEEREKDQGTSLDGLSDVKETLVAERCTPDKREGLEDATPAKTDTSKTTGREARQKSVSDCIICEC